MATQRARIVLPTDVIDGIDLLVGPRGRSAFIADTMRSEIRKRRLLAMLESDDDIWKDKDHPELAEGSDAWVRKLRRESDHRFAELERAE